MQIELMGSWIDLRGVYFEAWRGRLNLQLMLEMSPEHEHYSRIIEGLKYQAVAKCDMCDDVVYGLEDDTYLLVHLTWEGRVKAPFPWADSLQNVEELNRIMMERKCGPVDPPFIDLGSANFVCLPEPDEFD